MELLISFSICFCGASGRLTYLGLSSPAPYEMGTGAFLRVPRGKALCACARAVARYRILPFLSLMFTGGSVIGQVLVCTFLQSVCCVFSFESNVNCTHTLPDVM